MERKLRTINLTYPQEMFDIIKGEREATVGELTEALNTWEDFFWHVITTRRRSRDV